MSSEEMFDVGNLGDDVLAPILADPEGSFNDTLGIHHSEPLSENSGFLPNQQQGQSHHSQDLHTIPTGTDLHSTEGVMETYPPEPQGNYDDPSQGLSTTSCPPDTLASKTTIQQKSAVKRTRKKKDPNAPAAVSSAYAFFFKETQASVKAHNPNAKFGEVSKIVASLWEALDETQKAQYRKKNEEDKVRYQREMAEYQAKLQTAEVKKDSEENAAMSKDSVSVSSTNNIIVSATSDSPKTATVLEGGTACIREGCGLPAIKSIEWEDEYCSNECVVKHCKNVFTQWIGQTSG